MRRAIYRTCVAASSIVLLLSTLAWLDAVLLRQHTNLLLVRSPWAVQVLLRERAVSVTRFTSRHFPYDRMHLSMDRARLHSESDGIWGQSEPVRSGFSDAWGFSGYRFALAGNWGDPAGRSNLVGVRLPLWFLIVVSGATLLLLRGHGRRQARLRAGCCRTCGYDLRGSAGRCPECGSSRQVGQRQIQFRSATPGGKQEASWDGVRGHGG